MTDKASHTRVERSMAKKLYEVSIKNLRLRCIIGINEWERKAVQDIIVSINFTYDASEAVENDDMHLGVNYRDITKRIISAVEQSDFNLLESLTDMVYNIVNETPNVRDANVVVEKPFALRFCDTVSVKISEGKENGTDE
jgi:D-erythro-7,8-dihydroneopterin triphosphate epimerase